MRVLIADDDEALASLMQAFFVERDHEVAIALDGNEALALASQHFFHLAVVDLFMPNKDGVETILDLKKRHPHMKILAISGMLRWGDDYLRAALLLGAHASLEKPFTVDRLLTTAEALVRETAG
jgi:DNA-binding response OmpR family regulator